MRYTEEQYNQKYASLSDKLKAFVGSESVDGTLADIVRTNKLDFQQWRSLGGETGFVLVGLEQKENFLANLKQYVGLDDATSQKVAQEVDERIFVPSQNPPEIPPPDAEVEETLETKVPENLPAVLEEREVTIRKITTNNEILDKQLEVPIPVKESPLEGSVPSESESRETRDVMPPAPTPTPTPAGSSIIDARLRGTLNIPKEEAKIVPVNIPTSNPPSNLPTGTPKKDPYREALE